MILLLKEGKSWKLAMTEGNFPKAKFNIKTPKINRGTFVATLLNSLRY